MIGICVAEGTGAEVGGRGTDVGAKVCVGVGAGLVRVAVGVLVRVGADTSVGLGV